jgi:hypothetical protein
MAGNLDRGAGGIGVAVRVAVRVLLILPVLPKQPRLARLLLAVAVYRHHALLGAAYHEVVAAGAHQVQ